MIKILRKIDIEGNFLSFLYEEYLQKPTANIILNDEAPDIFPP